MFWPSLIIVVCCFVFLRIETRRRRLTFCGRRADAASPLLIRPSDAAPENIVRLSETYAKGFHQLPPAPPSTPLPLADTYSSDALQESVIVQRSPRRRHRQLSLPSSFPTAKGRQSATFNAVRQSAEKCGEHVTVGRDPVARMWTSSMTLTELARRSCDRGQYDTESSSSAVDIIADDCEYEDN